MFGKAIKSMRQDAGLTQQELGDRVGVGKSTISEWESGKRSPDIVMLPRIAAALGKTSGDLLAATNIDFIRTAMAVGHLSPIPVVGTVKGGYGAVAYEDYDGVDYAAVKQPDEYIFLKVSGDSMSPQINAGELALVHLQGDVESGEIAVVIINSDEGTIKRVIKSENSVALQAFNPAYPTRIISGHELNDMHIVGKVVETKRKW